MAKHKKVMVNIKIVAEESAGILVDGDFVGNGELLTLDEQTAHNLINRGRAKLYSESKNTKKK
ncbi:hypothetical protein [Halodesulfovibrio sp. MK-HDV]|uniref:hypothetical protein n=1 Tax=Halodesulfovibrio sp. MK-HDV TaxID=2599925 RepID=UPI001370869B|nr:hypothetical protein [Halodesulfovibrio sp. MK-HDV]KAF1076282.1 hypothetical protein MKHDV_01303 [Halodesulfovibrio sp. MK-HDV]